VFSLRLTKAMQPVLCPQPLITQSEAEDKKLAAWLW
jgi:hypothetical protein